MTEFAGLKAFHAELTALIDRNLELESQAQGDAAANAVALELERDNLRSIIKLLRVKSQELADAVAPGKAPKEESKWVSERRAFMEVLKISREAAP